MYNGNKLIVTIPFYKTKLHVREGTRDAEPDKLVNSKLSLEKTDLFFKLLDGLL